ncbi:MAG: FHA domain-containing protein [Thioalkalispiraceae bacterium]|jgi:pSer/pThr/pTyr-binding forkhead associated (FHA) protein
MAALIQFASGAPGIKYSLEKRHITIGRVSAGNDICLPCSFVSKHHARLEVVNSLIRPGAFDVYIEDLGSTNKTYVNDEPITRCKLEEGDLLRIGRNTMKFDTSDGFPNLDPVEIDFELPKPGQSQTWNFSRRLSVMDSD